MWPNPQESADLVTFTEEILNGKLHSLCSVCLILEVKCENHPLELRKIFFINLSYPTIYLPYKKDTMSLLKKLISSLDAIFTSGAAIYFPISSQRKAYSRLVRPAPNLLSGSVSTGMKRFHKPCVLAFSWNESDTIFCKSFHN